MLPQSWPRPWRQAYRKPPSPEGQRNTGNKASSAVLGI
jgi:hypothetical protein